MIPVLRINLIRRDYVVVSKFAFFCLVIRMLMLNSVPYESNKHSAH